MNGKMFLHWDAEGDFLEVRFGKPTPSYYDPTRAAKNRPHGCPHAQKVSLQPQRQT